MVSVHRRCRYLERYQPTTGVASVNDPTASSPKIATKYFIVSDQESLNVDSDIPADQQVLYTVVYRV